MTAIIASCLVYSLLILGGIITSTDVSLLSKSFLDNPPTFTLSSNTSGGPPTDYTWRRDGVPLTSDTTYNSSIQVNGNTVVGNQESLYHSTLTVTGNLPGVYQYSVQNRANSSAVSDSFTIESTMS